MALTAVLGASAALLLVALGFSLWSLLHARAQLKRYSVITDVEAHRHQVEQEIAAKTESARRIQAEVSSAEARLSNIRSEVLSLEESQDLQSFGFYKAHYDFKTSGEYDKKLDEVRERQKALIKDDRASLSRPDGP